MLSRFLIVSGRICSDYLEPVLKEMIFYHTCKKIKVFISNFRLRVGCS